MRSIVLGLAIVGFWLNPFVANAALVTLHLTGNMNNGFGTVPNGSAFTADLSFDDSQTPNVIDPTIAQYIYSSSIHIGAETATVSSGMLSIQNDGTTGDRVTFNVGNYSFGGVSFYLGRIEFIDYDMKAL